MKLRMYPAGLVLGILLTLSATGVRADNPNFGAYDAPADTAASTPATAATPGDATSTDAAAQQTPASTCSSAPPCYNTSNPNMKGCPAPQCVAYDKQNPGYFSGLDAQCQLPAGTSMMMASVESTCRTNITNSSGFSGLFQFNQSSCNRGDLYSPTVQGQCFCDYTAATRAKYSKATNGQTPSAGMYYLFHQQGGCGLPLALGGNARAVDVVAACVKSKKDPMGYAMRAIGGNLPKGYDVNTITAQDFANIYLSKFAQIDNSNICVPTPGANPNSTTPSFNPFTATPSSVTQQMLQQAMQTSTNLTSNGTSLPMTLLQYILGGGDMSQVYTPIDNPMYDNPTTTPNPTPDTTPDEDKADKIVIITNRDGTKTVKVTKDGDTTNYELVAGQALWRCESTYSTLSTKEESSMKSRGCKKIAEVAAKKDSSK